MASNSGDKRSLRSWLLPSPRELAGPRERVFSARGLRSKQAARAPGGELDPDLSLADRARFDAYVKHFSLTPERLESMHDRLRVTARAYAIGLVVVLFAGAVVIGMVDSTVQIVMTLVGLLFAVTTSTAMIMSLLLRCYQIRNRSLVPFSRFLSDTAHWSAPPNFRFPRQRTAAAAATPKSSSEA